MNAQVISWSETADKGSLDGVTFSNGGVVLTVIDTDASKQAVDANTAYFGTVDAYQSFGYRLKTGGKSSSKNSLKLTVPADGVVKVYARTGSNSDNTRNIVLTQNDNELLNVILNEEDAAKATIDGEEKNVYPVYSTNVAAGDIAITYPVNSINIYALEFVVGGGTDGISSVVADKAEGQMFSLSGQAVKGGYKGLTTIKGKKVIVR